MPDTLQTSIELYDKATKPLRTIASAAETVTKAFRGVDTSASQAFGDIPKQIQATENATKSAKAQAMTLAAQFRKLVLEAGTGL